MLLVQSKQIVFIKYAIHLIAIENSITTSNIVSNISSNENNDDDLDQESQFRMKMKKKKRK